MKQVLAVLGKRFTTRSMLPQKKRPIEGNLVIGRALLLPTLTGWSFLITALIVLALSINFSALPGYLLGFLIASMLIVAMPLGLRNLARLKLSVASAAPVFLGEESRVRVSIFNPSSKNKYSLRLLCEGGGLASLGEIQSGVASFVEIPFFVEKRGISRIPPISISTSYPLGLIKVSVFWRPTADVHIYCAPELNAPSYISIGSQDAIGDLSWSSHGDILSGTREYMPGDSPRDLAWRQIAKHGGYESGKFFTNTFDSEGGRYRIFSDRDFDSAMTLEKKLSRLTAWVVDAESAGVQYGLNCFQINIRVDSGPLHCNRCLQMISMVTEE